MKIWKDKKIIALTIIMVIFTIAYFIIINKASYAFENDYDINKAHNNIIETIKKSAIAYANQHLDLFEENNSTHISVQDLIDSKILVSDEDGNIIDPSNNSETLNSKMIEIIKEKDNFKVDIDI